VKTVMRALVLGTGFGLAVAAVDLWLGLVPFIERRMGPGPETLAQIGVLSIALGALLGLAGAPLLALVRGRIRGALLHLAWLAGAWFALERWVELDSPLFAPAMYARPFGAAALVLVAGLLGRVPRLPRGLPWALGALLLVGGVFAPAAYLAATTPPAPPPAELPPAPAGSPDVVLVVLDTVRAHNVSSYGHARDTAPTLDALAREGALFLDASSPSTWSLPAHASLFTGRYPSSHGAFEFRTMLDDRFPTLAEALQQNGWETFCFTANPWISDGLGLTRGFAFREAPERAGGGAFGFAGRLLDRLGLGPSDKGGGAVAEHFEAWARSRPAGARPAFAFLNFLEAHFPYHQLPADHRDLYTDLPLGELRRISLALMGLQFGGPPRDPAEVGPPARDLYDGGVHYSDALLRRVVDALRARGTLDRTLLVVLADHGEILGEHGAYFGHGPSLYQKAIAVPLLLRYPARVPAGARVATPVSTLGVFATIAELVGLEAPATLQAGSLLPLLTPGADGAQAGEPVLAEVMTPTASPLPDRGDPQIKPGTNLRALRAGALKLVESSSGERFLYDLAADPGETRELSAERPEQLAELHARLEAERVRLGLPPLDQVGKGAAAQIDEATREHLRELGYVEE
jgi:arylsulfatase A-like enzyme